MILCCGEALIDMIPAPTSSGRDGYVPHAGGAVFNTAIALGRLGLPAGLLSGVSRDLFGQVLVRELEHSRVDTRYLVRSDRPTTLAFVKLVDGHADYSFYDENSAGRMLQAEDMPDLPPSVTALYFGGISLACEPGADAYAALLDHAGDNRAVMIDPNIRQGFISDEDRYRERLAAMVARSDIVKVSDEDLDWIVRGHGGLEAKALSLAATGPSLVIVTQGSKGATCFRQGRAAVTVAAKQVAVVDTVGAGDTFNAGVLADLSARGLLTKAALADLSPEDIAAALASGARVAAITVSRAGADAPWADEIGD